MVGGGRRGRRMLHGWREGRTGRAVTTREWGGDGPAGELDGEARLGLWRSTAAAAACAGAGGRGRAPENRRMRRPELRSHVPGTLGTRNVERGTPFCETTWEREYTQFLCSQQRVPSISRTMFPERCIVVK
jgi:hypothetical protein